VSRNNLGVRYLGRASSHGRAESGPGWWARWAWGFESRRDGSRAMLFIGLGWDDEVPWRPWPAIGIEGRRDGMVLAGVAFCGVFVGIHTMPFVLREVAP
jgi:hypothetical protein